MILPLSLQFSRYFFVYCVGGRNEQIARLSNMIKAKSESVCIKIYLKTIALHTKRNVSGDIFLKRNKR